MLRLLLALLLTVPLLAKADVVPDEVGAAVYTRHGSNNAGPQAWNNRTHGIYAIWDVHELGEYRLRVMAAALRLSNDRDGVLAALLVERGMFFASLGAVRGYEDVKYGQWAPDATMVCQGYCYWRTAKVKLKPAGAVGVRFDLPDRWKLRLSFQPKHPGGQHPFLASRRDTRMDASVTLWFGRSF